MQPPMPFGPSTVLTTGLMSGSGTSRQFAAVQQVGGSRRVTGRSAGVFSTAALDPNRSCGEPLLDHLVGALLKMQRHVEAERLGGLEIDRQFVLDRNLDRKLARLRAL